MNGEVIELYALLALALFLVLFVLNRHRTRKARRARAAAEDRFMMQERMRERGNRREGEVEMTEEYLERRRRMRELVERYNRERGVD